MTEEQQQEDVKPKINLVVDFEGQSECAREAGGEARLAGR